MDLAAKDIKALLVLLCAILVAGAAYVTHEGARTVRTQYAAQLAACGSLPSGSVDSLAETSRVFINLPSELYPAQDLDADFTAASGTAAALWVSNGGQRGHALEAKPGCSSDYYEFDGSGEVDLSVPSAIPDTPSYRVRFIVDTR